ncbi:iron complex outermembrane recepter protein [Thermoflexibacter ruber]|uniref:Iron complex outermembrane recepter protein n=2 Tax=Thermoflexibacter ruber TaxID=1003 RepID=A0A1I2AWX9_9BACT|nr:iron complex outermembrane recepter protein [Thermoflexibacter ruber]
MTKSFNHNSKKEYELLTRITTDLESWNPNNSFSMRNDSFVGKESDVLALRVKTHAKAKKTHRNRKNKSVLSSVRNDRFVEKKGITKISCLMALFFLFFTFSAYAQFSISGKVISEEDKQSMPAVNILIKGTSKGTVTDAEGKYKLEVAKGEYTLVFSHVGFKHQEKIVKVIEKDIFLEVKMQVDTHIDQFGSAYVYGTRYYPITNQVIEKQELQKQNLGQDLPILLNFTPSIVTTSDAGAGVGYTGMRIRGSDPTRINVTINGIPLNDSESQGVFWVNMPDFASSVSSLQIQRGVGTSTNGGSAFGASVNISTDAPSTEASAEMNNAYGSFNTWKHNGIFNTGKIGNFRMMGRLSKITSDGFIDRAFSDLKSFYLSGVYDLNKGSITANVFSGQERTYQAWNGVPEEILRQGNRTYNELTYENEIDNYQQDHYQLIYNQDIGSRWKLNTALHYTKGRGYFEQYREDEKLNRYGLDEVKIGSETIKNTDLIRRRWLDNDFYGWTYFLNYKSEKSLLGSPVLDFQAGGAWNKYEGKHFGEVIWARFASNGNIRHRYYDNDATKTDFNTFAKANYQFVENLFGFVDLQVRTISYSFLGFDNEQRNVTQTANFTFFNPKFGARYLLDNHEFYASYSVGNREPNRDDFTQSTPQSRPKHETLQNLEVGYSAAFSKFSFTANYYYMNYKNQLVLTGQINDVGAYIRSNIDKSYRMGIELVGGWQIADKVKWEANMTLSRNKIQNFNEFLDNYDTGEQEKIAYSNTDIAFSPSVIAGSSLNINLFRDFNVAILSKYVGRQYLDNTQNESRKLNPYFTNDIRLSYNFDMPKFAKNVGIAVLLNNIFNTLYESNGYTFGYIYENQTIRQNYYYPQAGFNFLMQLSLRF